MLPIEVNLDKEVNIVTQDGTQLEVMHNSEQSFLCRVCQNKLAMCLWLKIDANITSALAYFSSIDFSARCPVFTGMVRGFNQHNMLYTMYTLFLYNILISIHSPKEN